MRPFEYERPATIEQAIAIKEVVGEESAYLGGGTNLVDLMRLDVARPSHLIDISAIVPASIKVRDNGALFVGAGVRNSDLAADTTIRSDYPALSQALLSGASGQLRNMATVGGNLLQRTRCLYFQDVTKACNKRHPGSGCPARSGIHRDLAILGTSEHCIATHPSDMAVALAVLDPIIHVEGPSGARTIEFDKLYRDPGTDPSRDTMLDAADVVVGLELPPASTASRCSAYRKARDRASFAFATGSVAIGIELTSGVLEDVRIALGAVAPHPWRARVAEQALRTSVPSADSVASAIEQEMQAAELLPDNAFKAQLAATLTAAVLMRLVDEEARS